MGVLAVVKRGVWLLAVNMLMTLGEPVSGAVHAVVWATGLKQVR